MKLTILTDNTTRIDEYYLGEPGVCYYIEDGEKKILFDTGYSDVFVRNAEKMGIELSEVDTVVLSHGHDDHTRGLLFLPKSNKKRTLYAHPDVFAPKRFEGEEIGMPISLEKACNSFVLKLSEKPIRITENIVFLGQIPRVTDFEAKRPLGEKMAESGSWEPDFLMDDSAIVYDGGEDGITIITGCSHAGICNIVEYAKKVCKNDKVNGVIGGFHMMKLTSRVAKTVEYLQKQSPKRLCPCHCTCFHARAAIHAAVPVEEVCVGDVLTF